MVALIPARGGSKGVPNKNIKLLDNLPLIAHTISAAQKSSQIHRIIVSTDSSAIADVAKKHGAEVPFMREAHLAGDHSLAVDVYLDAAERLAKMGENMESFCVLQPTSPLRTSQDIDHAIALFLEKKADAVLSVCQAPFPISWFRTLDSNKVLKPFFENTGKAMNRQDEQTLYVPNGAIYIFRLSLLKSQGSYYSEKTYGYPMPRERSIDIDVPLDFRIAEALIQNKG